jgi:hypothetical protein
VSARISSGKQTEMRYLEKISSSIFLYIYKATEMKRQEIKEPVLETNPNTKFVTDYSIIRRRVLKTARNQTVAKLPVDYNIMTFRFPLPLGPTLNMPALFYKQHTSGMAFGFNKVYYSTGKDRLEGIDFDLRAPLGGWRVLRSKIYLNADKDKLDILKENKGKSGIYLWENIENGKIYIGSSINLTFNFLL